MTERSPCPLCSKTTCDGHWDADWRRVLSEAQADRRRMMQTVADLIGENESLVMQQKRDADEIVRLKAPVVTEEMVQKAARAVNAWERACDSDANGEFPWAPNHYDRMSLHEQSSYTEPARVALWAVLEPGMLKATPAISLHAAKDSK